MYKLDNMKYTPQVRIRDIQVTTDTIEQLRNISENRHESYNEIIQRLIKNYHKTTRIMKKTPKYIHYKKGLFHIMKQDKNYGSYKTLKEAEDIVQLLKQHKWDYAFFKQIKLTTPTYQNRYITQNNKKQYYVSKNGKTYGKFNLLKDARLFRDELYNKNWDVDMDYIVRVEDKYYIMYNKKVYGIYDNIKDAHLSRDKFKRNSFPSNDVLNYYIKNGERVYVPKYNPKSSV